MRKLKKDSQLKPGYVSAAAMKSNPAFWQLFSGNFSQLSESQIENLLQRGGDQKELAKLIAAGELQSINFADTDLIINLYAVFLDKSYGIDENQFVSAWQLAQAAATFKDKQNGIPSIKKYKFEEKSPYQLKNISYITDDQIKLFHANTKDFKKHGYYTINLPRKLEMALIYDMLSVSGLAHMQKCNPKYKMFIYNYFLKMLNKEKSLQEFASLFKKLQKFIKKPDILLANKLKEKIILSETDLTDFIQLLEQPSKVWSELSFAAQENRRDRESINFLHMLLQLNEQVPGLELSPDFTAEDPESPVICLVLFTIESLMELQAVLHGKDSTVPLFRVGPPSSLTIFDAADSNPKQFGKPLPARLVELSYPGITVSETVHGYHVHSFWVFWHDLLIHGFRNGANPFKDLIRYLAKFLQDLKRHPVSSLLWQLFDKDTNVGRLYREQLAKLTTEIDLLHAELIHKLFADLVSEGEESKIKFGKFWDDFNKKDTFLAILIDMNVNKQRWRELLKDHDPRQFFSLANPNIRLLCGENYKEFCHVFNSIRIMMAKEPGRTIEFYILAYRLSQFTGSMKALLAVFENFDIRKIVKWDRNRGLYFVADNKKLGEKPLEEMLGTEIIGKLIESLNLNKEFKNIEALAGLESLLSCKPLTVTIPHLSSITAEWTSPKTSSISLSKLSITNQKSPRTPHTPHSGFSPKSPGGRKLW